jgi:glycosyltransferase involved in cell wall biosynthesis
MVRKIYNLLKLLKHKNIIKKSGMFDEKFYILTYPDVRKSGVDPIVHYLKAGWKEGRKPNKNFDTDFYTKHYKDIDFNKINPFVHYILYGRKEGRYQNEKEILSLKKEARYKPNNYFNYLFNQLHTKENFVDFKKNKNFDDFNIKTIAFYLPQFHPIKENDEWWGKGFTEWTNVTKAIPQYVGHYQPHLPYDLGFYDLRLKEVLQRQVELARNYGIYGFCFHFYWFNGRRVLEKPLELFAKEIDFPFCINWANENWTRRWDGLENDVLLKQEYSDEDDIAFIQEVAKLFRNKNYIRVNNKPLLMIYRPKLFPDIKRTAKRWRNWCRENGIGEIYLVLTHSFEKIDPREIGFDAAVEFPPNRFGLRKINNKIEFFNPDFKGDVFSYDELIEKSIKNSSNEYKKFKGICPGWDNEARKPAKGTSLYAANPQKYKKWLDELCKITMERFPSEERFVFVNAWNEWAEGAHLEPDQYYGYAYLQATYDVLKKYNSENKKIVYVSHDAHMHGAQLLSLNIIRTLKEYFDFDVTVVLKKGGVLENEFEKLGKVYNLEKTSVDELIKYIKRENIRHAICNTVVSGDLTEIFSKNGLKVISLVHELPEIIKNFKIENEAKTLAEYSDKIVFPSSFVKNAFKTVTDFDEQKAVIRPQGLYKKNRFKNNIESARKELRKKYGLNDNDFIVLGVGFADKRKGFDIFVKTAEIVKDCVFIWVGNIASDMKEYEKAAKKMDNVILVPLQKDVDMFYAGADLYYLPSREDPFPSVVLEAMEVGVPVIAFKDRGGFIDIVPDRGFLAEFNNLEEVKNYIHMLKNDKYLYEKFSKNAKTLIEDKFEFVHYVFDLLGFLEFDIKKISVIVPNYNYEKFIEKRVQSIISQTYPIYEIIFLDDCSKDGSVEMAKKILEKSNIPYKIIINQKNSGNVFYQWNKGVENAKGDYIWIAEADDFADEKFVEKLMECFDDKDVVLAYSQSCQIDENDRIINENYLDYTNDISSTKWRQNYIKDGIEEIKESLSIKNTIPNVSAVIFKKVDLKEVLNKLVEFKIAGDWFFYVWILQKGKICYHKESLNYHRRHSNSVTIGNKNKLHFEEIVNMQEFIIKQFDIKDEKILKKIFEYRKKVKKILGV